jgi:hypothetical protein
MGKIIEVDTEKLKNKIIKNYRRGTSLIATGALGKLGYDVSSALYQYVNQNSGEILRKWGENGYALAQASPYAAATLFAILALSTFYYMWPIKLKKKKRNKKKQPASPVPGTPVPIQ